jgi:hypothetical protein
MLDVQIVGDSPEQVRATMTKVVSEIRRTLRRASWLLVPRRTG